MTKLILLRALTFPIEQKWGCAKIFSMNSKMQRLSFGLLGFLLIPLSGFAELRPDKVYLAESKKTEAYIRDGLVTGGDRAIQEFLVRDIRRATNAGYERIVIDLEGSRGGESVAIERPPYFQVAVTPDEKRLIFTAFGKPTLGFDAKKVHGAFKRSALVDQVTLLPALDEGWWTFSIGLKEGHSVEIFELKNPVRIIVDIRGGKAASGKAGKTP